MSSVEEIITEERLSEEKHFREVSNFECQINESLEVFLKSEAFEYNKNGQGNTYILRAKENDEIIGYYTLKANGICREFNDEYGRRRETAPSIEIARFALASDYQGRGLGKIIFLFFIAPKINEVKELIGVTTIMLFAVNHKKVIKFYQDIGLILAKEEVQQFIKDDDNSKCILMYMDAEVKDVVEEANSD